MPKNYKSYGLNNKLTDIFNTFDVNLSTIKFNKRSNKQESFSKYMPVKVSCSVVILTYKGIHHLEYLLPTVREAINNTPGYQIDVLIVDNGCDQKTKDYTNTRFPEFDFKFSPVNDYLFSLNNFVRDIRSDYTFILNDDMKLHPDVLNKTLDVISKDQKLFSVTCNIMDFDGQFETTGLRYLTIKNGWAGITEVPAPDKNLYYTWFAGGGAAVFNTRMYNELDGFDPLFRPAYCEDGDLSMRAWHRGWETIYHPDAILYHRISATIKDQMKEEKLSQLQNRQKIILFVRNLRYNNFLLKFILKLPYRLIVNWRTGKNSYFALIKSLPILPRALMKRFMENKPVLNDREITQLIGKKYNRY
ncbi:MAG: glycosyltransferase [Bacteroidetes bacterium]|nr:glycosyltransferase [Bacteroidota bacterium]